MSSADYSLYYKTQNLPYNNTIIIQGVAGLKSERIQEAKKNVTNFLDTIKIVKLFKRKSIAS